MDTILYFQSPTKTSAPDKIAGVRRHAAVADWHVQAVDGIPTSNALAGLVSFWQTKTTIAVKDLMMKRTMLSLVAVSIAAMSAFAAPYCGVEALPDLIKCLPAPPEPGSADFARDVARYEWGKEQRKDPERAALARHDSVWSYATVADAFSKPFGTEISPTNTPSTWKLLEDSLSTTDQMRVAPKAFYHRRRPFAYFNEEPLCPKEDGVWRDEGSYPSGHTMRSMVAALILAEINPAKADEIVVRAMQYGESRVIAGAHWQSDVDMTRIAAAIAYSRLHTLPAFLSQLELAKKEFAALRPDVRDLRERPTLGNQQGQEPTGSRLTGV